MIDPELNFLIKIMELRKMGFDVIENVKYEILNDSNEITISNEKEKIYKN